MNRLDSDDAEVLRSECLRDEKPQEERSEGTVKALKLLKASKEQAEQAEVESRESKKQLEEETFLDCDDGMTGVAEETPSQLRSAASTLDTAKDQTEEGAFCGRYHGGGRG